MGKTSSKKSQTYSPDYHANATPKSQCDCSYMNKKIIKYRWIKVPKVNKIHYGFSEFGRITAGILTLSLSTWINGGIKDLSHECIEIIYQCKHGKGRYTTEIINKQNLRWWNGYYNKELYEKYTYIPLNKTVLDAYNIFKSMKYLNLKKNNCYNWASKYWDQCYIH